MRCRARGPELAAGLLADIAARLADGTLLPLPHAVFAPEEVEAAFRTLQASTHIGKLVVAPAVARDGAAAPATPWRPDADGASSCSAARRASGWTARSGWRRRACGIWR